MRFVIVVLLALATPALARNLYFTEPAPLATTRYGAFGGNVRLVSTGLSPFLAWSAGGKIRLTHLTDGERHVGRPVLDVVPFSSDAFDIVWTGDHFLVAAEQCPDSCFIAGRLVDANGEPIGDPFTIQSEGGRPRLAFDGARVLMLYGDAGPHKSVFLDRDGLHPSDALTDPSLTAKDAVVTAANGTSVVASQQFTHVSILALDSDGEVIGKPHFTVAPRDDRRIAVASGENEFFIIWTNGDQPMEYATISARNATISGRTAIPETGGTAAVAAVREGDHWTITWVTGGAMHVQRLATANTPAETLVSKPADDDSQLAALSLNGHAIVAWRGTGEGAPITVRHLEGGTDLAAFAAAEQKLETTAATAESALLVFSEMRDGRATLYAGLRGVDGAWRETKIGDDHRAPLAATDGSNFAVITTTSANDWGASILDRRGRLVNVSPRVASFTPTGIAWTGTGYAIVGINGASDLAAYVVSPTATITGPVVLAQHQGERLIENPAIAARDGEALVVWQDSRFAICFPVCDPYDSELRAARLSPSLQVLDATPLLIAPDEAVSPDVVWDGSRYVIAWRNDQTLQWRTLTSHGSVSSILSAFQNAGFERGPHLAVVADGVAATMDNGDALLLTLDAAVPLRELHPHHLRDAVVALGERVGYVVADEHDEMPYHGASRLHLILGNSIQDSPAAAPHIAEARFIGNAMRITWTPPAAPVNGYRVEYRVDGGAWNELDEWFAPDETTLEIQPWRGKDASYQFRVRAMNDGGPGAYSNAPVVSRGVKRRAVR